MDGSTPIPTPAAKKEDFDEPADVEESDQVEAVEAVGDVQAAKLEPQLVGAAKAPGTNMD